MTSKDWFLRAQKESFAIGAFNIDSLEIFKAVLVAAKNKKSPVIVEFSPGEMGYFGIKNIVDMIVNAREDYPVPILLNLDHGRERTDLMQAIDLPGFDNVHFDGSHLSISENIKMAKEVVDAAHKKGLLVEGETDKISGSSEVHTEDLDLEEIKKSYTDPQKAAKFVEETGVDIFAPFFGNLHGTFPNEPALDMVLLSKIKEALPSCFLSLHGTSGISAEQIIEAVRVGKIVKANINTELRVAYRDALAEKLEEKPGEYKVYDLMEDVILAVVAVVEGKMDVLGSSGKA